MGAISHEIKIAYSKTIDCDYFFMFLDSLSNNIIPTFKEEGVLRKSLSAENFQKLKTSLSYSWSFEEDSAGIYNLEKVNNTLTFEIYGGDWEEVEELISILVWSSIQLGIKHYYKLESNSNTNGFVFMWHEAGKLLEYLNSQGADEIYIDLNQGFEANIKEILAHYKSGKIEVQEKEIPNIEELVFVHENKTYEDFLKDYKDYLERKKGEEKSNSSKPKGIGGESKLKSPKMNKESLGPGVQALLRKSDSDKKKDN